jgi:hypothetical protein
MLDNGDFGQVEYTAQSAVNLWLTARIACRRLGEREAALNPTGDAQELLGASYAALLDLLKRAYTMIDRHETKSALDNLRITLVSTMAQKLNGS